MSVRDDELEARDKRLLQYVQDNWSVEEISDREGMEPDYARIMRRDIAKRHGIVLPNRLPVNRKRQPIVGINDESRRFRSRLGDMVYLLARKYRYPLLSYELGIPQKALRRLHERGFVHNWTLGQLQRLATLRKITFQTLLDELNKKDNQIGFAK